MILIGLTSLIGVGEQIFDAIDGGAGLPIDQYYPAVKGGALVAQGPYNIAEVAQALERNPTFVPEFDAIIAQDSAWQAGKFGPLTTSMQKASAVVNWAHGGRDAPNVTPGERAFGQTIERLLNVDAQKRAEQQSQVDKVGSQISETIQAQGVTPLQLGLGAVTLFLLLRGG